VNDVTRQLGLAIWDGSLWELAMPLEDREHIDGLVPNPICDSVGTPEHLADVTSVNVLGHQPARERHLGGSLDICDETIHPAHGGDRVIR